MFTSFLNWLSCCWTVYCSLLKIYSSITKELRSSDFQTSFIALMLIAICNWFATLICWKTSFRRFLACWSSWSLFCWVNDDVMLLLLSMLMWMLDIEFIEKIKLTIALLFRDFLMWHTDCVSLSGELIKWKLWIWLFDVMSIVSIMNFISFAEDFIFKSMNKAFTSSNNSVFHKLSISKILD